MASTVRKKKVLQVLYSGLGGHGSVAFSLILGNSDRSINHQLLFYGIESILLDYSNKCERMFIPYISIKKRLGLDFFSWISTFKVLLRSRPGIIILHSVNLIIVVAFYAFCFRKKLIVVEHNSNKIKRTSEWLCSAISLMASDYVVYLTETYKKEVSQKLKLFFRKRKVKVIQNGIDLKQYKKSTLVDTDDVILLMQSRFTKSSKDHVTLIESFGELKKRLEGNVSVKLVLAGDGESRREMERLASELGLENCVEFPGMLDENSLITLLGKTDIYVHSSIAETMSTAIMQAMACGLPIIATDISGINDMLTNGHSGLLFNPGDKLKLIDLMEKLVNDFQERKKLGQNARVYAEQFLSNERMFKEYYSLMAAKRKT